MKKINFIFVIFLSLSFSQDVIQYSYKGYLKELQNVSFIQVSKSTLHNQFWTNRLEIEAIAFDSWTVFWAGNNRLHLGDAVKLTPNYSKRLSLGDDFLDLSWEINSGYSYVIHHLTDRLYLDWANEMFQITLGRQRINWGKNLIWNPNDLFNQYNPIDFDSEERTGVDAIRFQWYTGVASSLELVYRHSNNFDIMSYGAILRQNLYSFDWQLLAGRTRDDFAVGMGWSGPLAGAAFRGEWTILIPPENGETRVLLTSISFDYMFSNEIFCQTSVFWNSDGITSPIYSQEIEQLSLRNLNLAEWSLFFQIMYPLTPLINLSHSTIMNPQDGSIYQSPSVSVSLLESLDLLFVFQWFNGDPGTQYGQKLKIANIGIKWSF